MHAMDLVGSAPQQPRAPCRFVLYAPGRACYQPKCAIQCHSIFARPYEHGRVRTRVGLIGNWCGYVLHGTCVVLQLVRRPQESSVWLVMQLLAVSVHLAVQRFASWSWSRNGGLNAQFAGVSLCRHSNNKNNSIFLTPEAPLDITANYRSVWRRNI